MLLQIDAYDLSLSKYWLRILEYSKKNLSALLCWYDELLAGWGWNCLGMNLPMHMHVWIRERWVNKEISTRSKWITRTVVNLEQALKSNNIYCRNFIFSCCKINIRRQLTCMALRNSISLLLIWEIVSLDRVWLWLWDYIICLFLEDLDSWAWTTPVSTICCCYYLLCRCFPEISTAYCRQSISCQPWCHWVSRFYSPCWSGFLWYGLFPNICPFSKWGGKPLS